MLDWIESDPITSHGAITNPALENGRSIYTHTYIPKMCCKTSFIAASCQSSLDSQMAPMSRSASAALQSKSMAAAWSSSSRALHTRLRALPKAGV